MTLEKYRVLHSTLIEQYQMIEFDLEGLYAVVSNEGFVAGLAEVENDSMGRILKDFKILEKEQNVEIFSDDDYQKLRGICERRNFWCHECYTKDSYNKETKTPKNESLLIPDICTAKEMLKRVREVKDSFFESGRERIANELWKELL